MGYCGVNKAMQRVLAFAGVAEAVTGMALLFVPSIVAHLLLGAERSGVALPVARVAGIALLGLGIACWPGPPVLGILVYSAGIAAYLAYLGMAEGFVGRFLWPAVVLHVVLTVLLALVAAKPDTARDR